MMCVCTCVRVRVCVYVCACVCARTHTHIHTYTHRGWVPGFRVQGLEYMIQVPSLCLSLSLSVSLCLSFLSLSLSLSLSHLALSLSLSLSSCSVSLSFSLVLLCPSFVSGSREGVPGSREGSQCFVQLSSVQLSLVQLHVCLSCLGVEKALNVQLSLVQLRSVYLGIKQALNNVAGVHVVFVMRVLSGIAPGTTNASKM